MKKDNMTGRRVRSGQRRRYVFHALRSIALILVIAVSGLVTVLGTVVFWAFGHWYAVFPMLALYGLTVIGVARLAET